MFCSSHMMKYGVLRHYYSYVGHRFTSKQCPTFHRHLHMFKTCRILQPVQWRCFDKNDIHINSRNQTVSISPDKLPPTVQPSGLSA